MKYAKCLVALMALCIFIIPAFSMPDNGDYAKEGNHQISDDHQASDDHRQFIRSIGQDDQQPCMCPCGQEGHKFIKSMMSEEGQGPKFLATGMGDNGCGQMAHKFIKSMMGKKDMGPEGHKHIKSMMGDKMGHGNTEVKTVIINVNV